MSGSETLAWIVLPALIATSSFVSASEAALFSLDERGKHQAGTAARRLLDDPQGLLVTLLLTNLVVNLLFFAFAASLTSETSEYGELASGLVAVFVLVLFSEILPKTLALRAGPNFARIAAVPLAPLVTLAKPLRRSVQWFLDVVIRALGDAARPEEGISADALYEVLEHSARGGIIDTGEADLLAEVVELEGIRVREITTPRVDMLVLDLEDTDEEHRWFTIARALAKRITWLPVVRGGPDVVVGQVRMRDLLAQSDLALETLVQPVLFVPEVASVFDLLHHLRSNHGTEAIVVDEYGGTTGIVTMEQVFEEIVGDLRVEGERTDIPVVKLDDTSFRVAGELSIRDWNELFGRAVVPEGFESVGGLIAAGLRRIPKAGDVVRLPGLELRVHEVRGRRVSSVDIFLRTGEDGQP